MKKHLRELLKEVSALGGKVIGIEQNSHVKIHLTGPGGHSGVLIVSSSPSDRNAARRQRADVRRALTRPVTP